MFKSSEIEFISFDAAGTLIQPSPSVGVIYAEILHQHGVDAEPTEIENNFRAAFKTIQSQPNTLLDKPTWRSIVEHTLKPWAPNNLNTIFESLWHTFALPKRWAILNGVLPLLDHLKTMGYPMIVLSNNDHRLISVLNGLGLASYFQAIYISVEIGYEKPDTRIYQHITQTLNVQPSSMLHVGDSLKEDHQGALNAGWHSYCLNEKNQSLTQLLTHFQ